MKTLIKTLPLIVLLALACNPPGQMLIDAGTAIGDGSVDAQTPGDSWELADCALSHDVATRYRNAAGDLILIVTETHYYQDLVGDPADTLVRTCNVPTTTEWGCPISHVPGVSCVGDEDGPWPVCTVSFAGTDADGASLASCGVRVTRETIDGPSGQVTNTSVTDNPLTVYTRAN